MSRFSRLDMFAILSLVAVIGIIVAAFTVTMLPDIANFSNSAAFSTATQIIISPNEPLLIGLSTGLTGAGIMSQGVDDSRASELALENRPTVQINNIEFEVKVDIQDDQCTPEGGQLVANRFVSNQQIVAVIGPMCSSGCRAAAPIFDKARYTSISQSCTAPDLTKSNFQSFNRVVVSDAFQGVVAADFIYKQLNIQRIATLHDGSPYGEGLVEVLAQRFEEIGGQIVIADAVSVGDTEFRGLLEDVSRESPQLIYFAGFPAEAARLAEQRTDVGLSDIPFMSADGIVTPEFIQIAGNAANGVYVSSAIPTRSIALDRFLVRYLETYGEEPPAPYHTHVYDALNMAMNGVEATGIIDENGNLVIDRDTFAQYIRSIKHFRGLTGIINCDGSGECSSADIGISIIQDNKFESITVGRVIDGEVQFMPS